MIFIPSAASIVILWAVAAGATEEAATELAGTELTAAELTAPVLSADVVIRQPAKTKAAVSDVTTKSSDFFEECDFIRNIPLLLSFHSNC
jgi:hypothetical protein